MTGAEKLALTVAMRRLHTCQNTFLSIPICYAISPLFTLLEADFFSFFFLFLSSSFFFCCLLVLIISSSLFFVIEMKMM